MIGDRFLHFEVNSFYIHDIEANLNFINLNFDVLELHFTSDIRSGIFKCNISVFVAPR